MPALKTLGLVILSIFVVAIGSFGFLTLRAQITGRALAEALDKVEEICIQVIESGGSRQTEIHIPGGYTMTFNDNRISLNGEQRELLLPFAENLSPIPSGHHLVEATVEEGKLVVTWT